MTDDNFEPVLSAEEMDKFEHPLISSSHRLDTISLRQITRKIEKAAVLADRARREKCARCSELDQDMEQLKANYAYRVEERDQLRQQVESLREADNAKGLLLASISGVLGAKSNDECEDKALSLHVKITKQAARIAELEKDAARYRWLRYRTGAHATGCGNRWDFSLPKLCTTWPDIERQLRVGKGNGEALDETIDAALAQQEKV